MATSIDVTGTDRLAVEASNRISGRGFKRWYLERRLERDLLEGNAWAVGPTPSKDPDVHSPSGLLGCHRKAFYTRRNAPVEGETPTGLFWFGRRFEDDIVIPYLREVVTTADTYVQGSLWVDRTVEVAGMELRVRGATDPAIVTADAEPVLVTEIKTSSSIARLEEPRVHHLAQLHAYLYGLGDECDRDVTHGVLIYGDRESFAVKAFDVRFDPEFWSETVLPWMAGQATYEANEELPPAEPQSDWECGYCDYHHRCGKSARPYADSRVTGLLPMFDGYERQRVVDYLESRQSAGAKLTPTLAHEFPELVAQYGVFDWVCPGCSHTIAWDGVEWDGDVDLPPNCPACAGNGDFITLAGPSPGRQVSEMGIDGSSGPSPSQ